jgi:hypothetical protein
MVMPKQKVSKEKKEALEDIFKHLELDEINIMYDTSYITINTIADISDSDNSLSLEDGERVYAN